ncbi:hypothetical protein BD311DRAFT_128688 [Dichomitus squalens]|uniref:Uncharacterized protein n=1 Tax=Dichomitus squalens TaxID=114155 RepID=A0A4Q9M8H0_9APHY|nr:hypothetical protein BD311DRAFT_128688 [Dichomitus squalens]
MQMGINQQLQGRESQVRELGHTSSSTHRLGSEQDPRGQPRIPTTGRGPPASQFPATHIHHRTRTRRVSPRHADRVRTNGPFFPTQLTLHPCSRPKQIAIPVLAFVHPQWFLQFLQHPRTPGASLCLQLYPPVASANNRAVEEDLNDGRSEDPPLKPPFLSKQPQSSRGEWRASKFASLLYRQAHRPKCLVPLQLCGISAGQVLRVTGLCSGSSSAHLADIIRKAAERIGELIMRRLLRTYQLRWWHS